MITKSLQKWAVPSLPLVWINWHSSEVCSGWVTWSHALFAHLGRAKTCKPCWTHKPNTVPYAVTCRFAGVYDSFEVCTKVSMYLYRSMLFDLHHCTCIAMCLLPARTCTKYCIVRILFFGCLLYLPLPQNHLLIVFSSYLEPILTGLVIR